MKPRVEFLSSLGGSLFLAACGSGSSGLPSSFNGPTTTTGRAKTGELIRCTTSNGLKLAAHVPSPGNRVANNSDGPSASGSLQLTRRTDGSLVVSCKP